jgi:hypothetical protein
VALRDAGFILQVDDPALVDIYDWWFSMNDDNAGYRKWAAFQVEAVNHALQGIPEDRVRFHICWGSFRRGDARNKGAVDLDYDQIRLNRIKVQDFRWSMKRIRRS